ncbi:MAG: hypothetical protein B6D61_13555, partial [Bacteroidetes bacterium 4484_249]
MRNLLFSFVFILLAFQLLAQQQINVLNQAGNRLSGHSIIPRANQEQNHKMAIFDEMELHLPSTLNTKIVIREDSVFILDEEGYHKEVNTYDANGRKLTMLSQEWENETWVNATIKSYTYNSNGHILTSLRQIWKNSSWVNTNLFTYTNNANGNILTALGQNWENDTWINSYLYTSTYNNNGKHLTFLRQHWENDIWVNFWLSSFTYDINENILTELDQFWE